jgi:hypothetical protein
MKLHVPKRADILSLDQNAPVRHSLSASFPFHDYLFSNHLEYILYLLLVLLFTLSFYTDCNLRHSFILVVV